MKLALKQRSILPGFGLTLGFAVSYLCLLVLIPLAGLFLKTATLSWSRFWQVTTDPRVVAAYKLSFGASLIAAGVNVFFGFLVAWSLTRYRLPGRRVIDALVDLPFALPTAVAGISLTSLYAANGWLGRTLEPAGFKVAFAQTGVVMALIFVGLPFVVRTLQPVLEELDREAEEASASLGAPRWQTIRRVILPELLPALLTGFALAFARGLGEYGSVIFISGNMPMRTEIAPLLIVQKLEEYDQAGATAIAVVMLVASFGVILFVNLLQRGRRTMPAAAD